MEEVKLTPKEVVSALKAEGLIVVNRDDFVTSESQKKHNALHGKKYLTIYEACKHGFFKEVPKTIHNWIQDGKLKQGIHYAILKKGKNVLLRSYLETLI